MMPVWVFQETLFKSHPVAVGKVLHVSRATADMHGMGQLVLLHKVQP